MSSHSGFASLLLQFVAFTTLIQSVQSICYLPNGTSPDDNYVQPCATDPSNILTSTCCHTKWDNPPGSDVINGPTKDECMPNGLCQNRGSSSKVGEVLPLWTHYYRVMCTEKDFTGCLDVCGTGLNADDSVQLTPCDGTATSEKWCCGDNTDCCSAGFEYNALYIPQKLSNTSSAQSLYSAQVQNQTTTSNSTSTPPPAEPAKGLSGGAKAGIGIGAVLGVLLSLAAGFVAGYRVKKQWKRLGGSKDGRVELGGNQYGAKGSQLEQKAGVYASHELSDSRAHEIGGGQHMVFELADQGGKKN